jgi:hypothetical protein
MKKTILSIFLVGLAMASCKKAYTCDCVTTYKDSSNGTTVVANYKNTSVSYSEKMKEKQAKSACDHEAKAIQSNFESIETFNGTQTQDPAYVYSTACTLN